MNDLLTISLKPKIGVTESKKAEIDRIESEVKNAQYEVDILQIIVDSLTTKSDEFEAILKQAKSSFDAADANQGSLNKIINNARELLAASKIAENEMNSTKSMTDQVSNNMTEVVNKLIYSAEVVTKLSSLIVRRKALNPLISDELITIVSKLGDDANNAVSLALVALKSAISAQTSNTESDGIANLEVSQATALLKALEDNKMGIKELLAASYKQADANLKSAQKANDYAGAQLNEVTVKLKQATVKLNSLKKSLAAAKAASLAS